MNGFINVEIIGNALDNTLNGNSGSNRLYGMAGNDIFGGGGSSDFLYGGVDNDVYHLNSDDTIIENAGEGLDKLIFYYGAYTYSLAAGISVEAMLLSDASTGARNLIGNEFSQKIVGNTAANSLMGRGGRDKLEGGAGDDHLYGGTESDTLIGGSGKDTFVFDTFAGPNNIDTITDFFAPYDSMQFSKDIYNKLGPDGVLSSGAFYVGASAHDSTDRIIYNKSTGKLYYDEDGKGGVAAVQFAQVDAGLALTYKDFVILN